MEFRASAVVLPILLTFLSADMLHAARTEIISRNSNGELGEGRSMDPSMSADAKYIVFHSTADNLVEDDTNNDTDIFLRDRNSGTTTRISVDSEENEVDGDSENAEISADGNVVAFMSSASDLVLGDDNDKNDIFIRDRSAGTTVRVSVAPDGDGGDGDSDGPDVSRDGRYIVFESDATNLVDGDTNDKRDIFRYDRQTKKTIRVSLKDNNFDDTESDGNSYEPVISDDGRYVAFASDAALTPCDDNGQTDIFVRDITEGKTMLASVTNFGCISNGRSYHPSISADGRFVTFSSYATDLEYPMEEDTNGKQDVYVRDFVDEITERVSISTNGDEGDERSVGYGGNISADGQYVVFSSPATNLVPEDSNDDYDVFARDRVASETTRESVGHYWEEGSGNSDTNTAIISANGRYIVFDSNYGQLVPGDTNDDWDIFIRDYLWPGPLITKLSPSSGDYKGGTLVTISGSNFETGAAVTIDNEPALSVKVLNSTTITCITPPHDIGSVELKVTNPDGQSWTYPIGRGRFFGYIYRPMAMPWMSLLLSN